MRGAYIYMVYDKIDYKGCYEDYYVLQRPTATAIHPRCAVLAVAKPQNELRWC